VGARIAALVQLVSLTETSTSFTVSLRCSESGCQSPLEVELPLDALQTAPGPSARFTIALPGGDDAVARVPVGADQRAWRAQAYASRDEAVKAMLESLVVEGQVSASDGAAVDAIAQALAEHDPLVAFAVSYECPVCGANRDHAIDLERLALDRLTQIRRTLINDVHVLASTYGWTESEVLAVPPERRALYRALIDEAHS
jgi:hypothetical protein